MTQQILNGDCLELMKNIPDKSIDCILCDLPYGTTACKWDSVINFESLWTNYERIIKDDSAIILTANHPFTSKLVLSNEKLFNYALVWAKTRNSYPFFAKKRPLPQHEDILIFGKAKKYNPQMIKSEKDFKRNTKTFGRLDGEKNGKHWNGESITVNERYPNSVITISNPSLECGYHPTQKPVALYEYLIKTYTNENDLVLDNCAGSFTTAVACDNLNRNWICMEKEVKYCDIGLERINKNRDRLQKPRI